MNNDPDRQVSFTDRLTNAWHESRSCLCVGLDPDLARIPASLLREPDPIFAFNRQIIDATADLCCAYKPQIAYYAAVAAERSLERTIDYIRSRYPNRVVLLDAKRGDIGDTATQYAREAFERYGAHAVTANPYLGAEGLEPFLCRPEHGCFLVCRTSNPDSDVLQEHGDPPVFHLVAQWASQRARQMGNVGLVVGATQPDALAMVRALAPDVPLLVPGVGTQGGDLAATIRHGRTRDGYGLLISVSRALIYAGSGPDFADAARAVAHTLVMQMRGFND